MFSIIQAAGWPIWPLLLCSVVALALIIERLTSLRASRILPPRLLEDVLNVSTQQLPTPEMVDRLAENSVLGEVLAAGLRAVTAEPQMPEGKLRQVFEFAGRRAVHQLERYMNTLGTIATAAPLLGLMGTVVGMIEIFGSQTPGGNNPAQLAHGISIALYNTAFGLMIAIPALVAHRHFRGRIEEYVLELEAAADRLLGQLRRYTA
ncbi:MotA/TolQ/ExbB proton channel family protein [Roseateles sp. LKC17W]|uniref:MotA/TolQ/ExbB proton channel family protein n=1 Tax=Pelomonas margarita TaxID=3299031 RepID=A0ABW7FI51_9BURK